MIWGERTHLLKLQRRLLLSCSILLVNIVLFSEPAFINTELDAAGSLFSFNPAQFDYSYNFIDFGCANFSGVTAFNNGYINLSVKRGFLAYNFLGVFNYNDIRTASILGAGLTLGTEPAFVNLTPVFKYESYSDGVRLLKKGLLAGVSVKSGGLYSGIAAAALEGNALKTYVNAGYLAKNRFNIYMQAEMSRGLIIKSGIECSISNDLKFNASIDTEKRLICGFTCAAGSMIPHYGAMFVPGAGLSSEAGIMIISANSIYRLPEVEAMDMKEKNRIKMFKRDVKFPLNINRATVEEIGEIPSIGKQTALRIYLKRVYDGDYEGYESIDSIYGIGKASMEMIRKYTYIGD